jgi:hypothetical protein
LAGLTDCGVQTVSLQRSERPQLIRNLEWLREACPTSRLTQQNTRRANNLETPLTKEKGPQKRSFSYFLQPFDRPDRVPAAPPAAPKAPVASGVIPVPMVLPNWPFTSGIIAGGSAPVVPNVGVHVGVSALKVEGRGCPKQGAGEVGAWIPL